MLTFWNTKNILKCHFYLISAMDGKKSFIFIVFFIFIYFIYYYLFYLLLFFCNRFLDTMLWLCVVDPNSELLHPKFFWVAAILSHTSCNYQSSVNSPEQSKSCGPHVLNTRGFWLALQPSVPKLPPSIVGDRLTVPRPRATRQWRQRGVKRHRLPMNIDIRLDSLKHIKECIAFQPQLAK